MADGVRHAGWTYDTRRARMFHPDSSPEMESKFMRRIPPGSPPRPEIRLRLPPKKKRRTSRSPLRPALTGSEFFDEFPVCFLRLFDLLEVADPRLQEIDFGRDV